MKKTITTKDICSQNEVLKEYRLIIEDDEVTCQIQKTTPEIETYSGNSHVVVEYNEDKYRIVKGFVNYIEAKRYLDKYKNRIVVDNAYQFGLKLSC